jgi:hypothetical protein
VWNWVTAVGTTGGILVGIKEYLFEAISWDIQVLYLLYNQKQK